MYTVLFRSQEGNDARVVGSILDFVFGPEDYNRLIETISSKVWMYGWIQGFCIHVWLTSREFGECMYAYI